MKYTDTKSYIRRHLSQRFRTNVIRHAAGFVTIFVVVFATTTRAQDLNLTGITLFRSVTTNLNGMGVRVAQPEAGYDLGTNWEVNPGVVGNPTGFLTYFSTSGSTTSFPNSLSSESGHANSVGKIFYGLAGGVATNVAHVDNFNASYFYNVILAAAAINDPVVNQSFIFCNSNSSHLSLSQESAIDLNYDNYAAQYNKLFVSGAGNGGPTNQAQVYPPAACYNGLGVAAYGGNSCVGPTLDNGRCKPDITAPAGETSYSTPQVAGAAALLLQAGLRGDGGGATNAAADLRTVKAFLLNGAVKPADWTNSPSSPLDFRYGAGVLNVLNSYEQLAGGKNGYIVAKSVSPVGAAHPPTGAAGTIPVLSGWDFNTNSSGKSPSQFDTVNHYYFNVTNNSPSANFTATATLVWNRQKSQTAINNLGLFLYNCANSNLVMCSTSLVDNVAHLYVPQLAQGRYDLQVWKAGGSGIVSAAEAYALAYAFTVANLNITTDGTNARLTWPVYPAGFQIQTTATLQQPAWSTNNLPSVGFTNNLNLLILGATNSQQFFRLRQPNF